MFSGKKSPKGKGSTYTLLELPGDITSKGPTDEALKFTAAAYKLAYALGEPPTQGVAERLLLKRSTAGNWVMLARKRGFLGQTTERQAGA